jgi:hypothetical protein
VERDDRRKHQLLVWDVGGSTAPRPLPVEGEVGSPVVEPGGRAVAASVAGVGPVLCPAEPGPCHPITGGLAWDEPLRWSSDGRWLFVRRTPAFQPNTERTWIDRIEVATGSRQPWKELRPADPAGIYAIGGAYLTPDGKSYVYMVLAQVGELYLAEGLR